MKRRFGRDRRGRLPSALSTDQPPIDHYLLHPDAGRPGNQIDVLFGGSEAYPAMLDAIRGAKTEILLETYIWMDDDTGKKFVEAIEERARAGLRVHALVDGFGSLAFSEANWQRMQASGVRFAVFHPIHPWRRRWAWSVRDHRKILVVDGAVAFTGGLNIGDDYAPAAWGGRDWHDIHCRVIGPAVLDLRLQFFSAWRYASRENGEPPPMPVAPPSAQSPDRGRVQVLAISGLRGRRRIRRHYDFAVRRAQHSVRIAAAYFIPDSGWRRLLGNAVRRGVDVRVMFTHQSDVPAVQWAARATYGALLRAGVRVYEWLPSMLHTKVLSVDGVVCAIGSYNLDRRSLNFNWEVSLLVGDEATASLIDRRFDTDLDSCVAIDLPSWARRGLLQRLKERFFYALRRWL